MKLFKQGKLLLAGFVAALGLAIGFGTTAHATTWHRGMPSALRGTWKTKSITVAGTHTRFEVKIGKNLINNAGGFGDPMVSNNQSYHHKAGSHYYYVKGHETLYTNGKEIFYYKFYQKGNKMHLMNYLTINNGHKFSPEHHYGHWYYK